MRENLLDDLMRKKLSDDLDNFILNPEVDSAKDLLKTYGYKNICSSLEGLYKSANDEKTTQSAQLAKLDFWEIQEQQNHCEEIQNITNKMGKTEKATALLYKIQTEKQKKSLKRRRVGIAASTLIFSPAALLPAIGLYRRKKRNALCQKRSQQQVNDVLSHIKKDLNGYSTIHQKVFALDALPLFSTSTNQPKDPLLLNQKIMTREQARLIDASYRFFKKPECKRKTLKFKRAVNKICRFG